VIATRLFVGFSDDGRVLVPVLVLFFVFVIIIIIVGISRRYRIAADDGDEAPDVVRDAWSHDRLLRRRGDIHDDVSARVRARQSVRIAVLILKARRCRRFASRCGSVFVPASLSLSMMS